jgi:hypothetical protein
MLLALAKKLLADVKQTDYATAGQPIGTITEIALYATPRYGEVDGHPVTVIGEGNMVGFSPVSLLCDDDQEEAWIPKARLRNTDPRFLPVQFGTGTTRSRKTK